MSTTKINLITVEAAETLAGDLIRALEPDIGNADAITETLRRWSDTLDAPNFARVCMVVVLTTYTDCLTPTPLAQIPNGRHVFDGSVLAHG